MRKCIRIGGSMACAAMVLAFTGGCKKAKETGDSPSKGVVNRTDVSTISIGPQSSAIEPTLDKGWCGGHGVPESVCTRCNATLIPKFKEAGDWCAEHELPESQCTICHPEVEAEWAKLNPAAKPEDEPGDSDGARLDPSQTEDESRFAGAWCGEHGVPESVCTRCNAALIPKFQEAGDWCAEHGLPESQCTICNPRLSRGLEPARTSRGEDASRRLKPAAREAGELADGKLEDVRLERSPRLLTDASDPLCQVDTLRVRFLDPSIVRKAGIKVERVQRRAMSASIAVPAEVEFDATRLTRITPRVAGVVLDVPINVGSQVQIGDLMAVVDSPALGEAKSEYIERAQNLRLAEADLKRIETIFRGVQRMLEICTPQAEPDQVREALAESPVGEAKAKLLRAHAALLLARSEAARQAMLREKKLSSDRDYQAAQSALAAAEADFAATREGTAFNAQRDRLAADRAVQVARSALESNERRLHILGLDEEQIRGISTEPDERLSRFELKGPVTGRVVERTVAVGESVEASDVLFVIADTSTMWLMADVYERDLLQLRVDLPVHFTVDGMPGIGFEGRVSWISSQVDDRTRTVRLRADLPNADGVLRAKMFGLARIILHENEEVVGVPRDAVQTDGCCQLVFVQESETVFQPRKVVLGSSANGFVEVLRGLKAGERVASTGSFLMKTEILKSNIGAGCCEVDPGR